MLSVLNNAFLRLSVRADKSDRSHLVQTFVDVGPLFTMLSNRDHQILYGRRGTGKTHALSYLADHVESRGDVAVSLDMRTIGSSGGVYNDATIALPERATRLIVDILSEIHERILTYVLEHDDEIDLSRIGPPLDRFADAFSEIIVTGPVEHEEIVTEKADTASSTSISLALGLKDQGVGFSADSACTKGHAVQQRTTTTGAPHYRIHFGSVGRALTAIAEILAPKCIWVLIDEWSEVSLDMQPYLADLLRRTIFPIRGFTVKIAAIEQRCRFRISTTEGGYVGVEVGADIAANLNLDDFMVFDNDAERANKFFRQLFFNHTKALMEEDSHVDIVNPEELIQLGFTQQHAFEELVRAAEGVPRDAINILSIAAQRAGENRVSVPDIRVAAKSWYQRGKESAVANPRAHKLLDWIINEVIAHRKARAFMLRSGVRHELIDLLFDARVLHVVKHSVSAHDQPGVRFDVYSIDYGCYVDLINTANEPKGLIEIETDDGAQYVDVPQNDYRAIRRAILNLDEFEAETGERL